MVRGIQCVDLLTIHLQNMEFGESIGEEIVANSENIRIFGEKALVQLNMKSRGGAVGYFVSIQIVTVGLQTLGNQNPVTGFKLIRSAQQVFISGGTMIRQGVEAAAGKTFDHNNGEIFLPKCSV